MLVVDQVSKRGRESIMRWSQKEKLPHVDAGPVAANAQDSMPSSNNLSKHSVFKTPKRDRHEGCIEKRPSEDTGRRWLPAKQERHQKKTALLTF